jgi:hypothetical protein
LKSLKVNQSVRTRDEAPEAVTSSRVSLRMSELVERGKPAAAGN